MANLHPAGHCVLTLSAPSSNLIKSRGFASSAIGLSEYEKPRFTKSNAATLLWTLHVSLDTGGPN